MEDFNKKVAAFLRAGAYVIRRQGGTLTGGTPEGRLKAVVTNEEMLDSAKEAYNKIKEILDPNNVLNPDVKMGADSRFTLTHLRDKELARIVL
jgi:FAD/FMN-containing dehydrogenase